MEKEKVDIVKELGDSCAAYLGNKFGEVIRGKITDKEGLIRQTKIDCGRYEVRIIRHDEPRKVHSFEKI